MPSRRCRLRLQRISRSHPDENLADLIATLALTGQRAKIRTGGVTPDAFPTTQQIIRFVRTCLAANMPVQSDRRSASSDTMFSAADVRSKFCQRHDARFSQFVFDDRLRPRRLSSVSFLEDVMEEEFDEVFRFEDNAVVWRDDYRLNMLHIERLRKFGIQSFGSCSFDEPVADLQKLGVLLGGGNTTGRECAPKQQ